MHFFPPISDKKPIITHYQSISVNSIKTFPRFHGYKVVAHHFPGAFCKTENWASRRQPSFYFREISFELGHQNDANIDFVSIHF